MKISLDRHENVLIMHASRLYEKKTLLNIDSVKYNIHLNYGSKSFYAVLLPFEDSENWKPEFFYDLDEAIDRASEMDDQCMFPQIMSKFGNCICSEEVKRKTSSSRIDVVEILKIRGEMRYFRAQET